MAVLSRYESLELGAEPSVQLLLSFRDEIHPHGRLHDRALKDCLASHRLIGSDRLCPEKLRHDIGYGFRIIHAASQSFIRELDNGLSPNWYDEVRGIGRLVNVLAPYPTTL
jgi:hypothetical protein